METSTIRQQSYADLSQGGDCELFTTTEIPAILGMTRRKVLFFVEQGIIEPPFEKEPGRGRARKFGIVGLQLFELFNLLDRLGVAPRYLKEVEPDVRRLLEDYNGRNSYEGGGKGFISPEEIKAWAERDGNEDIEKVFPEYLVAIYLDRKTDRLMVKKLDYLELAGTDYVGRPPSAIFTLIDLRYLIEDTVDKASEYMYRHR